MILRAIIIAIALAGLGLSLVMVVADPAAWPMAAFSAVVVVLLLVEINRYQGRQKAPPREQLRATEDRFIDPETGRPVRVWLDPAGKRLYLDEPQGTG